MRRFWLLAVLCVGCDSGSGPSMDMGGDARGGMEVCMPDNQAVSLPAKYGIQANLLVNVKVPKTCSGAGCIVNTDETAKLLLLADVVQNGQSATVTATPCKIEIPKVTLKGGNKPIVLSTPTALVQSIKPVTASGTMDSTMTCASFTSEAIIIAVGANLAMPGTDALPGYAGASTMLCGMDATTRCLSPSTPAPADTGCVCDQDGDGKLGATLDAMNVPAYDDIDKVYVDLRTSVSLAGKIFPAAMGQANAGPRIKGKVENLKLDQNVLGCHQNFQSPSTPRDCNDSEIMAVSDLNPAVIQSPNGDSTFAAMPLAAGATCADLIAQETALFQ